MPADGKLQAGDRIFKVDGQKFSSSREFMDYVGKKKAGDRSNLTYSRKKQTKNVKINVQPFKEEPKRVGIGISLVDDKEIIVNPTCQSEDRRNWRTFCWLDVFS